MQQDVDIAAIDAPWSESLGAGRAQGGRPSQQDDFVCLCDPALSSCLLVLADGMGGEGAGELASAGVVEVTRTAWARGDWRELPGALFLEQLCQEAHLELRRRGETLVGASPHATVVALLLRGRHAYWAHVGDSRLYRFDRGEVTGCTEDHSLVQLRVRRGELSAEDAAQAPDQHQLLRGLGGSRRPEIEHGYAPWHRGQRFALCSDGVWEYLSGEELADFAERPDPATAVREALQLVMQRCARRGDNAALILVRSVPASSRGMAWIQRVWAKMPGWLAPRRSTGWSSTGS